MKHNTLTNFAFYLKFYEMENFNLVLHRKTKRGNTPSLVQQHYLSEEASYIVFVNLLLIL